MLLIGVGEDGKEREVEEVKEDMVGRLREVDMVRED